MAKLSFRPTLINKSSTLTLSATMGIGARLNKYLLPILSVFSISFFSAIALAEDTIEMRTTTIKGNTELPKILYLVPWQDVNESKSSQQKLVLHSLFGDLFDPVTPLTPKESQSQK
ncbi:hypothetical protein TDB9533_03526 [Thalassocella blandensis]|nr:hypothetical protein TDB9533_03526 [Thalassocella blandensis]